MQQSNSWHTQKVESISNAQKVESISNAAMTTFHCLQAAILASDSITTGIHHVSIQTMKNV